MTHEEIKAAIKRLEEMEPCDYVGNNYVNVANVTRELMDGTVSGVELRYMLIELLRQADPDTHTHIKLPVDEDGEPVHIGDEVEGDTREDGTVVGIEYYEDGSVLIAVRPHSGEMPTRYYDPEGYRHYHKPTASEILDELERLRGTGDYESVVMRAAELAGMLREVMADE